MLRPSSTAQVYLYADPVDMRKSIDGLSALVEAEMDLSPFAEAIFVFCNRGRDKVKPRMKTENEDINRALKERQTCRTVRATDSQIGHQAPRETADTDKALDGCTLRSSGHQTTRA